MVGSAAAVPGCAWPVDAGACTPKGIVAAPPPPSGGCGCAPRDACRRARGSWNRPSVAADLADALGDVGRERLHAAERLRQPARRVGERDRPGLEAHVVGEDRALLLRQLEPQRGLLLEVSRELARVEQPLRAHRDRLYLVAADGGLGGGE